MNQTLQDLGEYIQSALPQAVTEILQDRDELILVSTRAGLVRLMTFLRDDSNSLFKVLIDICGVDYPERIERFDIVYNLLSMRFNQRVRIKVRATEDDLVPSIVGVFSSANWYEREVWDLYGVMFSDHPDLRRILTDYGFEGHPMRKDFPLTGHVEVRYDEAQKRVVYEPVKLTQAFRSFDFMSPWEGAEYILPGDEKADKGPGGGN
ncbi:MAG: NADH-quinone oxidoreductase subunit C [Alphaproteobacteria bacterium]|jgi:NADH-quinone oxidoreductase subunit C